jgi:putative ABC transport system permease protein
MIQAFKLIWNNKGKNIILIVELMGTFMMVFGLCSLLTMFHFNIAEPIGFNYDRVWIIDAAAPENKMVDVDVLRSVLQFEEIEKTAMMHGNTPFMLRYWTQEPSYEDIKMEVQVFDAEDDFRDVMELNVVKGRWFDKQDNTAKLRPALINQEMERLYFGKESGIGKELKLHSKDYTVNIIGVIDNYKYGGELTFTSPQLFVRTLYRDSIELPYANDRVATSDNNMESTTGDPIFIKLKKGVGKEFEEKLVTELTRQFPGTNVIVKSLDEMHTSNLNFRLIPVVIITIIVGFLILNIFIGLFGVLWYNVSTRKAEIGLRRALGASTLTIYRQFISEMLILAMLGIVPGLLLAIQFPLLKAFDLDAKVYVIAMLLAALSVCLLVVLCAFLPSRQAAVLDPAVALRDE